MKRTSTIVSIFLKIPYWLKNIFNHAKIIFPRKSTKFILTDLIISLN